MALMPCHAFFQFYVNDGKLSCQLYQRSADAFLGVPFNISSYSLLTCMIAQICNLQPGEFIWTGGDCHLYLNHIEQAKLQINRVPLPQPKLKLNKEIVNIDDFSFEDIKIDDYHHHPSISAPISI
jgi:thymidylate synthase